MTNRLFRSPSSKVSNGHISIMLNKVLPSIYGEYHPITIRYDFVNEGIDAEAGLWGTIDGLRPEHKASEHSSFVYEAIETVIDGYRRDHPKDENFTWFQFGMMNHEESFHGKNMNIYNSNGLVIFTAKQVYDEYDHYTYIDGKPELENKFFW
jgi:hypothetical protein